MLWRQAHLHSRSPKSRVSKYMKGWKVGFIVEGKNQSDSLVTKMCSEFANWSNKTWHTIVPYKLTYPANGWTSQTNKKSAVQPPKCENQCFQTQFQKPTPEVIVSILYKVCTGRLKIFFRPQTIKQFSF